MLMSADRGKRSANLGVRCVPHVESPVIVLFLDQNYCYRLIDTQIPHDAGLAAIPCTNRKFLFHKISNQCRNESKAVRLMPRAHGAGILLISIIYYTLISWSFLFKCSLACYSSTIGCICKLSAYVACASNMFHNLIMFSKHHLLHSHNLFQLVYF